MTEQLSTEKTSPQTLRGACLCGSVSWEADGAADWCLHCHCASCRKNTGSPFTTFLGVANGRWRWVGATAPASFSSSEGVTRHFCNRCGTPMAYEAARWGDEMHFYAASLDQPTAVTPTAHVHWAERVAWIENVDALPRHEGALS